MEKTNYQVSKELLLEALSNKFNERIIDATFEEAFLQGGTVADVRLLTGTASSSNKKHNYKIVLKVQNKWERFGDPDSWRREYDLYNSNLAEFFTDEFRWPSCYLLTKEENQFSIWMEYAEGVYGKDFTIQQFEEAAKALGSFQGKLFSDSTLLENITNLSNVSLIKDTFYRYSNWEEAVRFINEDCSLPKHIHEMLSTLITNGSEYWIDIEKLPIILAQRDYWFTNIFNNNGSIICIDWDTTGWGHLGEDLASLIVDEVPPHMIVELYERCVPAYIEGFNHYAKFEDHLPVDKIIQVYFGLRIMADYMYSKTAEAKQFNLDALEAIYKISTK